MLQPIGENSVAVVYGDCAEHGKWEHETAMIAGRKIGGRCPKCFQAEMDRSDQGKQVERKAAHIARLISSSGIPPRFRNRTFENFHATTGAQRMVLERSKRYADNFPRALQAGASLALIGEVGAGKTHLACAIAGQVIRQHGRSVYFTGVYDMILRVKDSFRKDSQESEASITRELLKVDLLILDEIGAQFGTDFEKVFINNVINSRYGACRPTIILSNLNESLLTEYLGTRVLDRLREGGGGTLLLNWESYRERVAKDQLLPNPHVKPLDGFEVGDQ